MQQCTLFSSLGTSVNVKLQETFPPGFVYFMAFDSKFISICLKRAVSTTRAVVSESKPVIESLMSCSAVKGPKIALRFFQEYLYINDFY